MGVGGQDGGRHRPSRWQSCRIRLSAILTLVLAPMTVPMSICPDKAVDLVVTRNLTCSEGLSNDKNQSVETRWNCLVSRKNGGFPIVPGHLTINGELAIPIPPHFP